MGLRSENVDILSRLPEEILSQILSLMPTTFAVRTSILSKRWRYSWTLVHNLNFVDIHPFHECDRFSKFVDRVLEHCKLSQLKVFRLQFSKFWVPESCVSKWIDKAVKLNVSELDIEVRQLELPLSLFTCKTLTKFGLHFSDPYWCRWDCPYSVYLPNLKTLDIIDCFKPTSNALKLINGCPILENLSLQVLKWCNEEEYCFKIRTLKRLKLTNFGITSIVNKVVLNVPNLEYFSVDGVLHSHFLVEDLSSLVKAEVSCQVRYDNLLVELLKGISKAKSLSLAITYWRPSNDIFVTPLAKFWNLKRLELKGYSGLTWQLISQILECCTELEHLCIDKPHNGSWNKPQSVPTCMLTNLKTMEFKGARGYECEMKFLKFILGNSKALKMVRVTCDATRYLLRKEEEWLCAVIFLLPKASKNCQIRFLGSWPRSTARLC